MHLSIMRKINRRVYLLASGVCEGLAAAAGGASKPARANASIAIFQFPLSRFRILNQLPWMVLSLMVTG